MISIFVQIEGYRGAPVLTTILLIGVLEQLCGAAHDDARAARTPIVMYSWFKTATLLVAIAV